MPEKTDSISNYLKNLLVTETDSEPQIIIFSETNSVRLIYTLDFIFKNAICVNYIITSDENEFKASPLSKINYSSKEFKDTFSIEPAGLLWESEVTNFEPESFKKGDLLYFFKVKKGNLDYDIFSAVFYFISRYEEWLPYKADKHGRFELQNSILFKKAFHKIPVVDYWIDEFKSLLKVKYPNINFPQRVFKQLSTIDVDNVFAYKAKPWYRVGGALAKDMLRLDFKNFVARIKAVCFKGKDPFDAYDLQMEFSKKQGVPLIYFFLYSNNTTYDRTINPDHPEFIKLLKKISSDNILIGVHPSYESSEQEGLLKKEIDLLSKNTGETIICSRQHYLRFSIKTTPKQLIERGIQYDFTMGYASGIGFRAGTTLPFSYFDLETNTPLKLTAVPFCLMDGAFFVYSNSTVAEAKKEIAQLVSDIRKVNGIFTTVFHERIFSESLYPGWKDLYLWIQQINKI